MTGQRVPSPEDPRIPVIGADHPLLRQLRPGNTGNHIVKGLLTPIGADDHVHGRRSRPDVVGDRQRTPPPLGRDRPTDGGQQRLRVAIGDRHHRDLQDRLGLGDGQALGVLGGAIAGRERIARIHRHIRHGAALHTRRRPPATLGVDLPDRIAVIARIGIDNAAGSAVFLRELRLQPAPAATVADDDDLAFDLDGSAGQILVVVIHSIVRVDQLAGDVAIAAICVVGSHPVGAGRGCIAGDRGLAQGGCEVSGGRELERVVLECRVQHVELLDLGVPTPLAELVAHPFGIGLVVGRPDLVGLGGQALQPPGHLHGVELGIEALLERLLAGCGVGAEAEQSGPWWGGNRGSADHCQECRAEGNDTGSEGRETAAHRLTVKGAHSPCYSIFSRGSKPGHRPR